MASPAAPTAEKKVARPFEGRMLVQMQQHCEQMTRNKDTFAKCVKTIQGLETQGEDVMEAYGTAQDTRQRKEQKLQRKLHKAHLELIDASLDKQNKARATYQETNFLNQKMAEQESLRSEKRRRIEVELNDELRMDSVQLAAKNEAAVCGLRAEIAALQQKKRILESTVESLRGGAETQKQVTASVARVAPINPIVIDLGKLEDEG
eukprot:TRINITY_DN36437_c0_g1_i1.p1 TRINITY_DN36437_c0_g1~~TRINITY_DN36437_c0_g1_i1.p1  ORF type:complete len:225 (+),score=87.12 TRINITY_DN36437_c0_g1_i1:60-677(+)